MNKIFFEDFEDFIRLLIKYNVEYLIVGGYAVSIYSRPKNTGDIDIWINPSEDNAQRLLKAIDDFGFGSIGIALKELTSEGQIIQMGVSPIRIDIMTSIDGVEFSKAFKNKSIYGFGEIGNVFYISLKDLLLNKQKSDRIKDKNDLRWLKEYGKSS